MEDRDQIIRPLETNTKTHQGGVAYGAVLRVIMRRIATGPSALGLNAQENRASILQLRNLDINEIQRNALRPFYDQICQLLLDEPRDVEAMATLFSQSKAAGEEAIIATYESLIASLDLQASTAVETLKGEMRGAVSHRVDVDWPQIAKELPEYSLTMFERLGRRHNNPGAIDDDVREAMEQFKSQQDGLRRSNRIKRDY